MDFLAAVADQLEQAYDTTDPVAWVGERTGEHVWSKQADIMNAVAEHRRVAVRSCGITTAQQGRAQHRRLPTPPNCMIRA